jgi:hypothetical protein
LGSSDANLKVDKHVSDLCRRDFITYVASLSSTSILTMTPLPAFFLSLLDNRNSLVVGLTKKQLERLQTAKKAIMAAPFVFS